jgi:hypothetical protein
MSSSSEGPDPILLTLFANRFMSVAEAMGRLLQQTSIHLGSIACAPQPHKCSSPLPVTGLIELDLIVPSNIK